MLNSSKTDFEKGITLLKDDAGNLLKDAEGNVHGEIEVTLEDGNKEKAQILLNEYEAKLKNAADEVDDGSKTILLGFADQIDNTIARLNEKAKFVLEGTGKYGTVGGHHPLAKSAFKDNFPLDVDFKKYYDEAFGISVPQLEKFGGKGIHAKITGQQNSLYTVWKNTNPNVKMTIDDMVCMDGMVKQLNNLHPAQLQIIF